MKSFIFNNLVPERMRRSIIFKKTGVEWLRNVQVSDRIRFDYALPPNSKLWQQRLLTRYGHEPLIVQFYENYLTKEDIVFDVGSQMGYFPSVISALQPEVQVHCFEGNWFSIKYFCENKNVNDPQNKWVINEAYVASSSGKIDGVRAITLDEYCDRNPVPTIMQMDVDGEEMSVMNGAKKLLTNQKTEFIIEVHPADLHKRNISLNEFLQLFPANGLTLKYLPGFRNLNTQWTDEFSEVDTSEEFYIYAHPAGKSRFK